jgi:DNA-binding NarL/FixJ family response regulator
VRDHCVANAELGRLGGRTTSPTELTTTERQVAELVAQGLTNKETAAALFVSVRAVEANLTRIYSKLGIRSRAELAGLRG